MPDRHHDRRTVLKMLADFGSQRLFSTRLAAAAPVNHQHRIAKILLARNQMSGKQPRGRVRVGNGTVLADDGSLLRMVHSYVHDHFSPYYTDVHWWRAMGDVGRFN